MLGVRNISNLLFLLYYLVIFSQNQEDESCNQTGLYGCITCLNTSDNIVFSTQSGNYTCLSLKNCSTTNDNQNCTICDINYVAFKGNCYSQIQNCIQYSYNLTNKPPLVCTKCLESYMDTKTCKVNKNLCEQYDYTIGVCKICPVDKVFHQSKMFCIASQSIDNCLITTFNGCQVCNQQYYVNTSNRYQCLFDSSRNYQLTYINGAIISTCLQTNYFFNQKNHQCQFSDLSTKINYCKIFKNQSCSQCIASYFLSNNICQKCSLKILNCIICSDCNTTNCIPKCQICKPTHFVFNEPSNNKQTCRECSIYGCQKCQSLNSAVLCTSCQRGKILFNNTCYSCDESFRFDLNTLECVKCPENCANCTSKQCTWCIEGYALSTGLVCENFSSLRSQNYTITLPQTIYQIFSKLLPNQQELIFNNQIELMSSCKGISLSYTCLCTSNTSNVSSMCYNLTDVINYKFSKIFNQTISAKTILQNIQVLRLMAQVEAFDSFTLNFSQTVFFTDFQIASLLQIYTQVLRRQFQKSTSKKFRFLQQTNLRLNQLFNLVKDSWSKTFSVTEATVIYGNGYYMKYYPNGINITDSHSSFISVQGRNNTSFLFLFVWFDNKNQTNSSTGTFYAFSLLETYNLNVTIKKIRSPSISVSYVLNENEEPTASVITQTQTNKLTFTVQTSTGTNSPLGYSVVYTQNQITDLNSLYASSRIQFIFYQPAFAYVLTFLVAYLFLIPCCSLLDFVNPKRTQRRKKVQSQDSEENSHLQKNQSESSQQESGSIYVNYKDFFPIYNICNTPRPRRILKLCLFLLNMQHGITFLTLIYFNFEEGHPVLAVVLGVPVYFCTIIMSYFCGILTLVIPGLCKYLINIFALGYWILWIVLMARFKSYQYQPYVIIFAIVFFAIDIIIDFLEMFIVHFSIIDQERKGNQYQKKSKMFECLAAWLSKRGYFQYNQLIQQMKQSTN